MAERNIIMKNVKKIISAMLSGAMALTICAGAALNVSAATVYREHESNYDPGYSDVVANDSFEKAELFPAFSLYNGRTYYCLRGDFASNEKKTDTIDYYKFSVTKGEGNKGRYAIRLDNMASGNNFDLYLYDANRNCIAYSTRTGNQKDIVKTPEITATTDYYLVVRAETKSSTQNSTYDIFVEDYIKTETKTVNPSPTTLTTKPDVWSPDATAKVSVPANAIVTEAKVTATKVGTNAYDHVIRVKLTDKGEYATVSWKSGEVKIPDLVGVNCSGQNWYVGFMASELPQMIGGQLTYTGYVSLKITKLTVTYEYDCYPDYPDGP